MGVNITSQVLHNVDSNVRRQSVRPTLWDWPSGVWPGCRHVESDHHRACVQRSANTPRRSASYTHDMQRHHLAGSKDLISYSDLDQCDRSDRSVGETVTAIVKAIYAK
jgi:hypothetical protein